MVNHSWIVPMTFVSCAILPAISSCPAGWRSGSLRRLGEGPQRTRHEDHKRDGRAPRSGETKFVSSSLRAFALQYLETRHA